MRYVNKIELCGVVVSVQVTPLRHYTFVVKTESAYYGDLVIENFVCDAFMLRGLDEIEVGSVVHLFGELHNNKYLAVDEGERSSLNVRVTDIKIIYE